jgi:hypothetical protein
VALSVTHRSHSISDNQTHISDEHLRRFIRISEVLLDAADLPEAAARAFFRIILEATPRYYAPGDIYVEGSANCLDPHPFDALWEVFTQLEQESTDDLETRFNATLTADVSLSILARNIIIVWYNGYLGNNMPPAEIYPCALVWQVIRANPPGIPGPYYGEWAYPPSNPILPPGHRPHKDQHLEHERRKRR